MSEIERDEMIRVAERAMADAMPGAVGPNVRHRLAEAAVDAVARAYCSRGLEALERVAYPDPMTTRSELRQVARDELARLGARPTIAGGQ